MNAKRIVALLFSLGVFFGSEAMVYGQDEPAPPASIACEPLVEGSPVACLVPDDQTPLGFRRPIILISGWNPLQVGLSDPQVWDNFTAYAAALVDVERPGAKSWVSDQFKFYRFFYNNNLVTVRAIAGVLADLVDQMDAEDPSFAEQQLFLVGHSMGGLIGLSFMVETRLDAGRGIRGGERVWHLTTLATPYHGSPLANGPARDAKIGLLLGGSANVIDDWFFGGVPWYRPNRSDLRADRYEPDLLDFERYPQEINDWLEQLQAVNPYATKISAYAGVIPPTDGLNRCFQFDLGCGALVLSDVFKTDSDGVVPQFSASAAPCSACTNTEVLVGYNHTEMATGKSADDSYLFNGILAELTDFVWQEDDRFNSLATFGYGNESFHDLRGWGAKGRDVEGSPFRYQTPDLANFVDVFVETSESPIISFKRGDRSCEDDLEVYLKINTTEVPLYVRHNGQVSSMFGFPYQRIPDGLGYQYRFPVSIFEIPNNRVRLEFLSASGKCGPVPMYWVSITPQ